MHMQNVDKKNKQEGQLPKTEEGSMWRAVGNRQAGAAMNMISQNYPTASAKNSNIFQKQKHPKFEHKSQKKGKLSDCFT